MKRGWVRSSLLALALALPGVASAEERISSFRSNIGVLKDGSVDVTETIEVNVENVRINHGIFRDFPLRYHIPQGSYVRVGFDLLDASLDGQPVRHSEESIAGGTRIKLGDPDRYVSPGPHIYQIHYRADRELGHFKDFDELYWNVTGNGWVFPIDSAEVTVRLPKPVKFTQHAYYTGLQGSQGQLARLVSEEPGQATITTTAPLGPNEGLTVALAWPKGVVDQPTTSENFGNWFARNGASLVSLLGLWALAAYYWVAWKRAGRDPDAGTMVPLFSPPEGMSPAAVRYMMKRRVDPRTMSSTLVSLGVHGDIRIDKEKGGFFSSETTTISRTPNASDGPLSEEERGFLTSLIPDPSGSIEADNKNHETFEAAKKSLDAVLTDRFDGKLFFRNWAWNFGGIALFLAVMMAAGAAASWGAGGSERIALPVAVAAIGLIFRFVPAFARMSGKSLIAGAVGVGLILLMVVSGAPLLGRALEEGNFWPFLPIAIGLPIVISAFWWMPSPTVEGQKLIDRILGFKHYLSVTEANQLDRLHPPADTPEIFEKYLPYAIALDVENRWAKRFTSVLAAAAAAPGGAAGFAWYSGSDSPWN
ncbi:MAG: DUF2207 domain-containing protein, partial [Sphingomonas sp.]|nr:DUF2207 domain-containing protein [Sphingomonas sp.]